MSNLPLRTKQILIALVIWLCLTIIFPMRWWLDPLWSWQIQLTIFLGIIMTLVIHFFREPEGETPYFHGHMKEIVMSIIIIIMVCIAGMIRADRINPLHGVDLFMTLLKIIGTLGIILISTLLWYHITTLKKVVDKY